MTIEIDDRIPIRQVCYLANLPRTTLVPLLAQLDIPVEFDPLSADVWTSRTAIGAALRAAAEQ